MIGSVIFVLVSIALSPIMMILINRSDYNKKKYWINVCKNNNIPIQKMKWYDIFNCDGNSFHYNYFTKQMYHHNWRYDDIIKYLTKNVTFIKISENKTYTELYDIFYNYNFVGLNIDDVDKLMNKTSITICHNTYIYNNTITDIEKIMCIKCYTNDNGIIENVELLKHKVYV